MPINLKIKKNRKQQNNNENAAYMKQGLRFFYGNYIFLKLSSTFTRIYRKQTNFLEMGVKQMLWWIIGIAVGFGVISGLIRRKFSQNSFEAGNHHERQLQEEERVKAGSWFSGGQ